MQKVFFLKIIATFAPIMMKHLFCILACALLLWGLDHTSERNLQGIRTSSEVLCFDSKQCIELSCSVSSVVNDMAVDDNHSLFYDDVSNYQLCDGIPSGITLSRSNTSSKSLKFNFNTVTIHLLRSLCTRLPEEKAKDLCVSTSFNKYSSRYYVYTLEHILI